MIIKKLLLLSILLMFLTACDEYEDSYDKSLESISPVEAPVIMPPTQPEVIPNISYKQICAYDIGGFCLRWEWKIK